MYPKSFTLTLIFTPTLTQEEEPEVGRSIGKSTVSTTTAITASTAAATAQPAAAAKPLGE